MFGKIIKSLAKDETIASFSIGENLVLVGRIWGVQGDMLCITKIQTEGFWDGFSCFDMASLTQIQINGPYQDTCVQMAGKFHAESISYDYGTMAELLHCLEKNKEIVSLDLSETVGGDKDVTAHELVVEGEILRFRELFPDHGVVSFIEIENIECVSFKGVQEKNARNLLD